MGGPFGKFFVGAGRLMARLGKFGDSWWGQLGILEWSQSSFRMELLFIVLAVLYFLPTMVGWSKRNAGAIFVLNLLLGWTFIGWVVALVWALTYDR